MTCIIDDFRNAEPFILDQIEKITGKMISITLLIVECEIHERDIQKRKTRRSIHFAADKAVGESVKTLKIL